MFLSVNCFTVYLFLRYYLFPGFPNKAQSISFTSSKRVLIMRCYSEIMHQVKTEVCACMLPFNFDPNHSLLSTNILLPPFIAASATTISRMFINLQRRKRAWMSVLIHNICIMESSTAVHKKHCKNLHA